jgi:Na+/melibiose symporter-like transporter
MQTSGITDIAHGIQLAVAPVFLLSAVGSVLAVLTNRLARIIDRARVVERIVPDAAEVERHQLRAELTHLSERANYVHTAITLSTSCALIICVVIVTLFVGVALGKDLSGLIVILFILGLCAFIAALICFLLEIRTATASIRFKA